jgi:hypothetical protein
VDAVVINRDPMIGGLTIVQAKRYIGVIGVSHIRELVGTMRSAPAGGYSSQRLGSRVVAGPWPRKTDAWSLLTAHGSVTSSKNI